VKDWAFGYEEIVYFVLFFKKTSRYLREAMDVFSCKPYLEIILVRRIIFTVVSYLN